ncbi:glycosyltransferase [Olleya namhaensis]|uniref:Glycosyltransferase involved in cell wall bisynthesis n=1 Tax=Olleya namhaensis TaxID=1144750 RepID=A0A1I3NJU6_9FLAO|nr:glycosyltransferase [Olleya namhaensis]SFJ09230.1 Glycosyltransferase involved in cell wall bisynthesis [Olleya namhaensis]
MEFNKKKVLLVLQVGTLGGAERQALGLGRYLTKYRNCNVDILFTSSNKITKDFQDFYKETGINQIHYFGEPYIILRREFSIKNLKRLKWSVQYLLRLRKGLKQEKYDVVIPFLNFPSKIAYYLYKILPTVKYTFWHQLGLDFLKKDIFESVAVNNMPCIIGNAENCFDIFKKDYKVQPSKFNLLPQYITLNREDSDMSKFKTTYGINKDKIVFGMIAHFRSFKYHDLALKIFYELSKNYDTAHLILQGNRENDHISNDIYLSLKQEIFDLGISDKVTLLSNVKVVDVLNVLDVGMLLSLIEGTPNVVMEYMLYGLPVISSNHPGCIGLLGDSKFLVKNNDENGILKAMELLLNGKDLREIEGNNNLKRIKDYDIDSYVIKLEQILTNYFD